MGRIQAVDRALMLLSAVADGDQPQTAAQLAAACGMNRTTAWRLLGTLEHHRFVERDSQQRYGVGYACVALAASPSGSGALLRAARPVLIELVDRTGVTVTLSVGDERGVIAVEQIDPPDVAVVLNYRGKLLPLHATSNGKVLLGDLSEDALERVLRRPLEALTPATVVDPGRVRALAIEARSRGYAVTVGELDEGVNGISVGVEYGGRLVAMLSLSDTERRLPRERLEGYVSLLRRAALELERALGRR